MKGSADSSRILVENRTQETVDGSIFLNKLGLATL